MQRMLIQLRKHAAASPSGLWAAAVSPPGNDSGISRKKINRQPRFQFGAACFRRKTTTRYAGEPEKVLLMRRKKEPPVIEW